MSETPTDRVELTNAERGPFFKMLADYKRNWITTADAIAAVESIVAARVAALTAERDEKGCPTHVLLDPECVKCAYHAYHRANASLQTACNQREELRAELARWVEDWGSFTPGECVAGIHPDFAFDHEDSVTCPICAADKWKSEHDLSASITHQLQIETDRLQAELAAANARIRELEEGKDGPYACCRCCPDDDPEYHAENPPNSHSTWCKSCGTPSAIAERDALQARCAELEAQKVADHETWLQEVEERDAMLIERDATLDRATAALRDFRDFGIRADLNPTVNAANPPDYGWWSAYLRQADERVRDRARAALTPEGTES